MVKRVLIITGLMGSRDSLPNLRIRYSNFNISVVNFQRFEDHPRNYTETNYHLYVGHSMGAIVLQNAVFIPSYKIHTYGSPHHWRGKMIQDFIEGHPVKL